MEKFMLIFHGNMPSNSSPEELQAHTGKWMAWVDKLSKEGKYVSGEGLRPGGKLVTSKNVVTDGPYTEGKELVAGFFVVKAATIEEAIADAKENYPGFAYGGTIQVRQVMKYDM